MRHKWFFLVGVTAVMYASPGFAQEAAFEAYHDSAGEVVQLSSQASDPFLFLGKQVEAGHPLAEKYAKSLQKFPDVQSCLVKAERGKLQPDLTQFDWNQLQNNEDAEVCLFRVASSYSSSEAMKKWVEIQGFEAQIRENVPFSTGVIVNGHILLKQHWPKVSSNIFVKLWIKLISYAQTISIHYDNEGQVHSTYARYNTL